MRGFGSPTPFFLGCSPSGPVVFLATFAHPCALKVRPLIGMVAEIMLEAGVKDQNYTLSFNKAAYGLVRALCRFYFAFSLFTYFVHCYPHWDVPAYFFHRYGHIAYHGFVSLSRYSLKMFMQ